MEQRIPNDEPLDRAMHPVLSGEKRVVLICSAMRSGSTMLKALLAVPSDVSDLPETNFQRYKGLKGLRRLAELSEEPVIVLKRPAWYHEVTFYPKLPHAVGIRGIALVRDVYDTVVSLKKMMFGRWAPYLGGACNRWLAEWYWAPITENLIELAEKQSDRVTQVRYEDILETPIRETARLFEFIGSQQAKGVDSYNPPEGYSWEWGSDDGGERIRSLKVHKPKERKRSNRRLWRVINTSERVIRVRERIGYPLRHDQPSPP